MRVCDSIGGAVGLQLLLGRTRPVVLTVALLVHRRWSSADLTTGAARCRPRCGQRAPTPVVETRQRSAGSLPVFVDRRPGRRRPLLVGRAAQHHRRDESYAQACEGALRTFDVTDRLGEDHHTCNWRYAGCRRHPHGRRKAWPASHPGVQGRTAGCARRWCRPFWRLRRPPNRVAETELIARTCAGPDTYTAGNCGAAARSSVTPMSTAARWRTPPEIHCGFPGIHHQVRPGARSGPQTRTRSPQPVDDHLDAALIAAWSPGRVVHASACGAAQRDCPTTRIKEEVILLAAILLRCAGCQYRIPDRRPRCSPTTTHKEADQ